MKRYGRGEAVKVLLSVVFLVGTVGLAVMASAPPSARARAGAPQAEADACCCGKVHPDAAGAGCVPPPLQGETVSLLAPFPALRGTDAGRVEEPSSRRVSVASMVQRALVDQRGMLQAKLGELRRWGPRDQAVFAKWFGTTHTDARKLIYQRVL